MTEALVRVYGILTTSKEKVQELDDNLSLYGIGVVQLHKFDQIEQFLRSGRPKYIIKGVIIEQTRLIRQDTGVDATFKQLELVTHVSNMDVYYIDKNTDTMKVNKYQSLTNGWVDLLRKSNEKTYDWDDIFVVEKCNLTYMQLIKRNKKVSSRDQNISKMIDDMVYYKERVDLAHNPQRYNETVDFTKDVWTYVKNIPQFSGPTMKKLNLYNIFINAINQGVMFRSVKTRREKLYWVPGLNAGIPLTPKKNDPIHELTFQIHDFSHMNAPDLVFDGNTSKLHKLTYIAYRLMSECVTLVLADMLSVYAMQQDGVIYETRDKRQIYPIIDAMLKQGSNVTPSFIRKLIFGSFKACFYGDYSVWQSLLPYDSSSIEAFDTKYRNYFIEDFKWTRMNWNAMAEQPIVYHNWWNGIKNWRELGINLELQSVSEFIDEFDLAYMDDRNKILETIFNGFYDKYIARLFEGPIALEPEKVRLTNKFIRYMMGQSIIFFKYDFFIGYKPYWNSINSTLSNYSITNTLISNVRLFYNQFMKNLMESNLITLDDYNNWIQICPIFPPFIIDYDHNKTSTPMDVFVQEILN